MYIADLCYELYKIDWLRRISPDMMMDTVKNYYEGYRGYSDCYNLDEYIFDNGYANGCLYVCQDEFLGAEFQDREFMKSLLDNDALYSEYLECCWLKS